MSKCNVARFLKKIIKLYGWELGFRKIIDKIRESELAIYLKFGFLNAAISFTWGAASFLVNVKNKFMFIF
jgi:hypothetical protein